jgi:hypothetical protein
VGRQLGSLFGPLQGLTGLAGFGGITAAITSFISTARDIGRTARAIGVTTDALQQFRFAAGSAEVADTALSQLRKTLVTLNKGGKATETTVDLFNKLGISMEQIKAGKIEEILPQIVAGFENIIDPQKQAEAGMAIFGKRWQEVAPFILKGTAALAAGAERFKEFGITVQDLKAAEEGGAALKNLGEVVDNVKNQIAGAVLPAFVPMVKAIADFVKNNKELLKQVALPAFIAGIATAVVSLGVAVAGALGPWGLLAAAIAAAAVAIYQNWGDISKWFDDQFGGIATALGDVADGIKGAYVDLWNDIKAGWQEGGLAGAFEAWWKNTLQSLEGAGTYIADKLGNIDWAALGTSLLDAFNDIDWLDVGQRIGKALGAAIMLYIKANIAIGEWLLSLDWATIGATAGKLLIESFKLVFWTIPQWGGEVMRKLVTAAAEVDWGEVLTAILEFFGKLGLEMLRIGGELIKGLIKGMLAAIGTSFGEVTAAIGEKLSGIGSSVRGAGSWIGRQFGGGAPAPANDNASLIQRNTAAAGGAARSNVGIDLNVNAPPGSTVSATTSQSGAPVDVDVGRGTMTAGA